MNHLRSAFFVLAASLTMLSCKKDSNPTPNNPVAGPVKKIQQDAQNFATLEYNANGQVSKFKVVNEAITTEASFTYGANNKPVQALLMDYKLTYKYAGGVLDKIEYSEAADNTNEVVSYEQFTWANNRITEKITYGKAGDDFVPVSKKSFTYYANGDLQAMNSFDFDNLLGGFTKTESTLYEYDTRVNPLSIGGEVIFTLYLNPSVHNITKETVRDENDVVLETRTSVYTYNNAGLPLTETQTTTYPNSPAETKNIIYTY